MNIEMRRISQNELLAICCKQLSMSSYELQVTLEYAKDAETIVAYFWGEDLLGILTLTPISLISNTVYAWIITTPEVSKHSIPVARIARETVKAIQAQGKRIISHCIPVPHSLKWVSSLGARFCEPIPGAVPYVIECDT